MKTNSVQYVLKWSGRYLKQYRFHFLFLILLSLVSIALSLFQVNTVQRLIDAVLAGNRTNTGRAFFFFAATVIAMMLQNSLFESLAGRLEARTECSIQNRLLQHILKIRLDRLENISAGEMISRYDGDIHKISGFFRSGTLILLINPLLSVCGFLYLFHYSPLLSLGVFFPVPFFAFMLNGFSVRAGQIYEKRRNIQAEYTEVSCDIVNGAEAIFTNQMAGVMLQKMDRILQALLGNQISYVKNGCLSLSLIMSVTYVPGILAFLFGGILALNGQISVSLLFAYSQLIGQINAPVVDLFSSLNRLREVEKSMRRLDDLFLLPEERQNGACGIINFQSPVVCSSLCFSGILDHISFQLLPGTCTGIAGKSGAGKTTLLRLICSLYAPSSGSLSLFGREVSDWNLSDLRRHIACVFQENQIFPGTVSENIRFSSPAASQEEIESAARLAGLDEFIRQLPAQYETLLNGQTDQWSGGQYQRLNLARAFLQNAQLYLFDEPSASLDAETEKLLIKSIRHLCHAGKTVLIVSHRPALLQSCDRILFLSGRTVTEAGSHQELLENRAGYYHLYQETTQLYQSGK